MAIEFDWDLVQGWSMRENGDGTIEIVRPVMVRNLVGVVNEDGTQNPYKLIEARQAVIAEGYIKGSAFSGDFPYAFLEDYNVRTIDSTDAVIVELVYRKRVEDDTSHGSGSIWTLSDATNAQHVQTFATADGSQSIRIWYKAKGKLGAPPGEDVNAPAGGVERIGPVHKVVVNRIITATAYLRNDDWIEWKKDVRAAAGKINADSWGEDTRGTWLFLGPQSRFFEKSRKVVHVTLTFAFDPNGHYPILAYFDERGLHPADCDTEATLRAVAIGGPFVPPPVNTIRRVNGLTIASVQKEVDFTPLFAFTPDQD